MTHPSFGEKIEKHAMLGICFWFLTVAIFPAEVFVMSDPKQVSLTNSRNASTLRRTSRSTPELLKNKRQQPHRNPYMKPNINRVTQNIRGTQGMRDRQGNVTNLGDIKTVVDLMLLSKKIDIYLL
jgi:hypothetical protein